MDADHPAITFPWSSVSPIALRFHSSDQFRFINPPEQPDELWISGFDRFDPAHKCLPLLLRNSLPVRHRWAAEGRN
jgi:hypothetical protein